MKTTTLIIAELEEAKRDQCANPHDKIDEAVTRLAYLDARCMELSRNAAKQIVEFERLSESFA